MKNFKKLYYTESEIYRFQLKPILDKKGFYYKRFEQSGIPDLYIAYNRNVLWAEIKSLSPGQPRIIRPDWRPGQLAFIKDHELKGGGDIFFLILGYMGMLYFLPPKKQYIKEELVCQRDHYFQRLMRI